MKSNIQFESDSHIVHGKFYSALDNTRAVPTILLLAGFPGNEEDVLGLGSALSQHGLNVATFNYRGTYQSEGDYSLKNTQLDIRAAIDFLKNPQVCEQYHIDSGKLILGGWSYGGGMGLTFAANHPETKHIFSIAGTDHGEFAREYQRNEMFANMVDSIFEGVKSPQGPVRFAGKTAIRNELIRDPEPYDLLIQAPALSDRDILLIGGWDDENVVIENHILPLYRMLRKLGNDKVTVNALPDNHAFEKSRSEVVTSILNWIGTLF